MINRATAQESCDGEIFSFELQPIQGNEVQAGCTPLHYQIKLVNPHPQFPTATLTLTLTVDPIQFAIDPSNTGGFPASVASTNPNYPGFVDFIQFVTLQPEQELVIDFQGTILTSFANVTPKVDVHLFLSPTPANPSCSTDEEHLSLFPNTTTRHVGTDGGFYNLTSVATDNPNDQTTDLTALSSYIVNDVLDIPRQDAVIHGTMTINAPYNFNQFSNLMLSMNAKIIVNDGASPFAIIGSNVRGCDAMWEAIEVSNLGKLTLLNSAVEDAKRAIKLDGLGFVTCVGNTFTDNNVSLYGTSNTSSLFFYGNTMTSSRPLKTPLSSQEKPKAGVELENIPTSVSLHGFTGQASNKYINLYNGIIAKGTTLSVKNSIFKDITEIAAMAGVPFSGHGIHVENTSTDRKLTQEGFGDGSTSTSSFDNCTFGIFNIGTNLDAKNNRMLNMTTGIESRNCQLREISIKQNRITASLTGINMWQNTRVKSAFIEDNLVIVADLANIGGLSNATGIRADENVAFSGGFYNIDENTINIGHGRRGISLTNGNLIRIRNNTVWNSGTVAESGVGIDVTNSRYLPISCNFIDGNTLGFHTVGLHVESSFETRAKCNTVEEHHIGINYYGMCNGAQIRGNQMSNENIGFLLGYVNASSSNPAGFIGEQRYRGNLWNGGFGSFPASFPGATPAQAVLHRFLIDPNQTPAQLVLQNPPGVNPSSGWFTPQTPNPNESTFTCPTSGCNGDPDFPENLSDFDGQIANGSDLGAGICVSATNWTAKRHLYTRLKDTPDLASGNLLMQGFLSAQANTTVGAFYEIEHSINQMLTPSTNDEGTLANNRAAVDTKAGDITSIEAQIDAGGLTETQIAQLRAQQTQLQADIANLQQQSDATLGSIATQKASAATNIRQSNNAISATQVYEQNQQQVNDIFLQTIAVGNTEFTTTQLNTLLSIANQCAICGGDGVYLARSMYAVADPNIKFIDEELCAGALPLKKPTMPNDNKLAITMLPNPASYWVTLQLEGQESFVGQLQLFDLSGKLINALPVSITQGEPFLVDLSEIQSGFYCVKILQDWRVIVTEKLIITR
ncbi:MAG: T9SS type A sorting domain-containing protein [Saprospiraceae bacterium]|nr:T9SS type A sorting domain-containing protein [Saprospiraceae bacterium]MCF8250105.1 T9SS type A sorting domain-containing protein [Saprospiraceae bacterium]MCF8279567.1 T9SS type A sorting domain-containing protein [Bacteroidales bacterium]MCF8311929.1 T9SS type A sorting domain-containing protein [Saprospiraceae bacterium]MCF8440381.1 T9SS type A sorting domain-containing protein [Saprospiraceae bacterium]